LSTPPAFVLSQDQTLRESLAWYQRRPPKRPTNRRTQAKLALRRPLSDSEELSSRGCLRAHLREAGLNGSCSGPAPIARTRAGRGSNLGDFLAALQALACGAAV